MTETKKTPEQLPVQTQKLVSGINLIFAGIGEILSAMEPDMAKSLQALASMDTAKDALGYEELPTENDSAADEVQTEGTPALEPEKKAAPKKKAASPETTITSGDIIKIIKQKISKDRGNTAKIAAIVKTYGVETVKEIPPEKYEAFLTDVAQL